ncbi:hypothetical protein U1Q18_017266 [Sarracenia purpurea var. burkii]
MRRRSETDDAGANKKPAATAVKVRKLDEAVERAALGGDSIVDTEDNPATEKDGLALQQIRVALHNRVLLSGGRKSKKKALEALVQQRYLQKEKAIGPECNTPFYELAERAKDGDSKRRRSKTDDADANKKPAATAVKVRKLDEAAKRASLGGDLIVDIEDNLAAEKDGLALQQIRVALHNRVLVAGGKNPRRNSLAPFEAVEIV